MLDPLLTEDDVSLVTGRAVSTLQKDRCTGAGIPFVRLGRLVRYRESDVNAYVASLPTHSSTSDADMAKRHREAASRLPVPSRKPRRAALESKTAEPVIVAPTAFKPQVSQ